VSEICTSKEYWAQIIPEVYSFVAMMRNYAEHLQKSSQLTNNSHNSTKLVHMPSKNYSLTTILGSLNINSNYKELQKKLATKDLYSFIKISEFFPSQYIEHHKWILELKLSFPICLYSQGNYLENLNYVWQISKSNSNNNEHELIMLELL
ncbi:16717_t:CDS:2, partial [Gigaspora rosea]